MLMNVQQFFDQYQNESLLYDTKHEVNRGQCVQAVCFYVAANGYPVIWADAVNWFTSKLYADRYERIDNTPSAVPQPGDIIVWDGSLANSKGAGHIAVVYQVFPGTGQFISIDSNWGGKTVHKVTHNYDKVIGWLRFRNAAAPAPQAGGDEMIANETQAVQAYKMLRPNGGASGAEISGTAGRRTWAQFANDAQAEVNVRDAALRDQAAQLTNLSEAINAQNQTITELRSALTDATKTAAEKKAALDEAIVKLADQNQELVTAHDTIAELSKNVQSPVVEAKLNPLLALLNWAFRIKK